MLRIESIAVRSVLIILSFLGMLIFLLPMNVRIVNIGNLFGLSVCFCLFVFSALNHPISVRLARIHERKAGRICLSVIGIILLLGVLYCLILSCLMYHAAHKKPKGQPQAIILLGCKVRGTEPSLMLYRRIQAGYRAALKYPDALLIVSGGKGKDEEISEAECMAKELISMGIPQERIIMEDRSVSTSENMRFSKQILNERGINGAVVLVTDGFHALRSQMLAKKEGIENCSTEPAETPNYLLPTYWVREWFGVAHTIAFGN